MSLHSQLDTLVAKMKRRLKVPDDSKKHMKMEEEGDETFFNGLKAQFLRITDPVLYSIVPAHPHLKWISLIDLPRNSDITVQIYSVLHKQKRNKIKEYKTGEISNFRIPEPLEDGVYAFRVVIKTPEKTLKSPFHTLKVDFMSATRQRINCIEPWTRLVVGRNRANPCCNLKQGAGFLYNSHVPGSDPFNSQAMVMLREALLAGDTRYCHPGCQAIKNSAQYSSPEEAFKKIIRRAGLSEENETCKKALKAFVGGHLILDTPLILKVSVGSICNHNCIFCKSVQTKWVQGDATYDMLDRYFRNINQLMFTGGEPLLYMNNIFHKYKKLQDSNSDLTLNFITNGGLLSQYTDLLKNIHKLRLYISMNAASRDVHYKLHRRDDFEKICEGIRKIKQARGEKETWIQVKMIYMRSNYREIIKFTELAQQLGVQKVTFTNLSIFEKADIDSHEEILLTDPEWQDCTNMIENSRALCAEYGMDFSCRWPGARRIETSDPFKLNV